VECGKKTGGGREPRLLSRLEEEKHDGPPRDWKENGLLLPGEEKAVRKRETAGGSWTGRLSSSGGQHIEKVQGRSLQRDQEKAEKILRPSFLLQVEIWNAEKKRKKRKIHLFGVTVGESGEAGERVCKRKGTISISEKKK